eukprot:m.188850 g.188850  ORF g.188850 m.188850 type:complete len:447 (+) comp21659_c2_seq2:686-2026(+)
MWPLAPSPTPNRTWVSPRYRCRRVAHRPPLPALTRCTSRSVTSVWWRALVMAAACRPACKTVPPRRTRPCCVTLPKPTLSHSNLKQQQQQHRHHQHHHQQQQESQQQQQEPQTDPVLEVRYTIPATEPVGTHVRLHVSLYGDPVQHSPFTVLLDLDVAVRIGYACSVYPGYRRAVGADLQHPSVLSSLVLQCQRDGIGLLETPLLCRDFVYLEDGYVLVDGAALTELHFTRKQVLDKAFRPQNNATRKPWQPTMETIGASLSFFSVSSTSGVQSACTQKGTHQFVTRHCRVCTTCKHCTGYGAGCCRSQQVRVPGAPCGCGSGKFGCRVCGICQTCMQTDRHLGKEFLEADVPCLFVMSSMSPVTDLPASADEEGMFTCEQVRQLALDINKLSGDKVARVVALLRACEPALFALKPDDGLEIDFEKLQNHTRHELRRYLDTCFKSD